MTAHYGRCRKAFWGLAALLVFQPIMFGVQARADDPPPPPPKTINVNVEPGQSYTGNVGAGFDLIDQTATQLNIRLSSDKGTIVKSEKLSNAPGTIWFKVKKNAQGQEDPNGTEDETHWRCTGIGPNDHFWCIIKCTMAYQGGPGKGGGTPERWMSVSDVDFDADTDNDNLATPHHPPSYSQSEDYHEYPGVYSGELIGLIVPVNDNNDVGWNWRDGGFPMNRDADPPTPGDPDVLDAALGICPKKAGTWWPIVSSDICLYTNDGTLATEANLHLNMDQTITPPDMHLESEPTATSGAGDALSIWFFPEEPSAGECAADTVNVLFLGCDIDVDSNNDGVIDDSNEDGQGEDFFEAHLSDSPLYSEHPECKLGMIVRVNDVDNNNNDYPDNGWNGTDWSGPDGNTVEDADQLKPGKLRGLGVDDSLKPLLIPWSPILRIKKLSGAGAVRLFSKETDQFDNTVYTPIGVFAVDNMTADQFGGQYNWERLHHNDLDIRVEGLRAGEVMLAYQLLLNGVIVHQDVVRITVMGIDLDIDSDNNNEFDPPGHTAYEDRIEDKSGDANFPGKVVVVDDGDVDNDGIPDFADGFDYDDSDGDDDGLCTGLHFVPVVLEIPAPIDLNKAKLRITYDASDPAEVTLTGTEPNQVYTLPSEGSLRLWKKNGSQQRNKLSFTESENGDYVPSNDPDDPDDWYDASDLAKLGSPPLSNSNRTVTLYVEAVKPSADVADKRILVEVDPDPDNVSAPIVEDAVRVTAVRINLIADTDRDGTVDAQKDLKGKADWTKTRGAIFSVNCDRDGSRTAGGVPIPDAIHFNDSGNPVNEDFLIENDDDQQDIAPMLIRKIGVIPSGFKVFLKTSDLEDVQRTHVYKKIEASDTNVAFWGGAIATATSGADASGAPTAAAETRTEIDITRWVDPANDADFQGDGTTGDATFGLEGLMFRFVGAHAPAALTFNGVVDFTLELRKDTTVIASSAVRLKVAPWMMLSRDQASEEEWAVDAGASNATFRADLGVDDGGQLHTEGDAGKAGTRWFQDHIEVGYTQRPGGPKTHAVFRLPYARSGLPPNPTWPLFDLLGGNVGAFQLGVHLTGGGSHDYGGNLEVLPPNVTYPLGRIAMGEIVSDSLSEFLASQEVQSPVFDVPTRWLAVGHIDEVTSFLAGGDVAIADPTLAWTLISDTARVPTANRHKAVFFATGAAPEGGTVGGATSTRLYDGPATGTVTAVKLATKATGSITTVAKVSLADGETFTIGDGRSTKTFEFDVLGNGVAAGNVVVDVSPAGVTTADDVRDVMIAAINGVASFAITAEADGAAKLKLTTALPGTIGNVAVTDTVANVGFVPVGMAGGADDGILDGETVTISDGTTSKTFEFDTFGGVTAGNVQVDLSTVSTADEVRDALIAAINGVGSYTVESVADGSAKVHLWNETKGTAGNQAITETVANAGFTVAGMSGGKAGGRDFTGSWNYVRTFTYNAAGKPDKGQVAHIKTTGGRHDGWIEIDNVWDTTSKLVAGGGASHYIYEYTEVAPPPDSKWFNIPTGGGGTPDKYVIVQGKQDWYSGMPAIVTVEEVLADADFEALNKTDAQGQINNVKARLDTARTGLVYKSVPCLFFGDRAGFATGESAVAFNPGPTNLQTVNGHMYVPKQFCPLHQTTSVDIFATAISDTLGAANVRWVDDWDYYHANLGEVHCGTSVKHTTLSLDWWSNQP